MVQWFMMFQWTDWALSGICTLPVTNMGSGNTIILRPFESGKARCFADAQLMIARHLCENIPFSIKYPALPQSMKMAIGILQKTLG